MLLLVERVAVCALMLAVSSCLFYKGKWPNKHIP